jgi:hypothetical protein
LALTIGTWIVIGSTLYSQLESSHKFANKIVPENTIATPLNQEKISNIKDAQDMVDRTSSSIYPTFRTSINTIDKLTKMQVQTLFLMLI